MSHYDQIKIIIGFNIVCIILVGKLVERTSYKWGYRDGYEQLTEDALRPSNPDVECHMTCDGHRKNKGTNFYNLNEYQANRLINGEDH